MKPCLITYYTPLFKNIADITVPRMREYSEVNGFDFIPVFDSDQPSTCAGMWRKIDVMLKHCSKQVVWIDVDCYLIDLHCDLRTTHAIRTALDGNGLCTCVLSVGTLHGWRILQTLRLIGDPTDSPKADQSALRHLVDNFPGVAAHVKSDIAVSDISAMRDAPIYHAWSSAEGLDQAVYTLELIARLSQT